MAGLTDSADHVRRLLQLRVTVAFLGEKGQSGWWLTQFLQPSGQRFLEFIYPRSAFSAAVNAASEAAKNFHDERIGKGGVAHLFRLPTSLELRLHELLLTEADAFRPLIESGSAAKAALEQYSKPNVSASSQPEGPILIGDIGAIFSGKAILRLGYTYFRSLGSANPGLPYFSRVIQ
jgi:hypothetical protein